jgi:hypothetical protein
MPSATATAFFASTDFFPEHAAGDAACGGVGSSC